MGRLCHGWFRLPLPAGSYVTELVRRANRRNGFAFGDKLVADVAVEVRLGNGTEDGRVIEFLGVVHVMPARVARSVDVTDVVDVVAQRSEEHTSELQSPDHLVCRLLLEKKKKK